MIVSDNVPKIYVLGPHSSGKTTFIQKYFTKELNTFENMIVESSEMKIPEKFSKIFLILPSREKLSERQNVENSDEEYFMWLDFYAKNQNFIEIKWVKEF